MKRLLMLLVFLLSLTYSLQVCEDVPHYSGCSATNPSDFGCSGTLSGYSLNLGTHKALAYCNTYSSETCRIANSCNAGETLVSSRSCGTYNVFIVRPGRYSDSEARGECKATYSYARKEYTTYSYVCTQTFLGLCTAYETRINCVVDKLRCASSSVSIVSCSQAYEPLKNCWTVNEGSCNFEGTRCRSGDIVSCDGNKAYFTEHKCSELGSEFACKEVTDSYAVCLNVTEQENMLFCEDAEYKRCNPLDMSEIQVCREDNWGKYESCSYGCNASSVNETVATCNNLNTEGECDAGDQFCHDTGSYAFQFLCAGGDWVLTTTCNSGRCNDEGTSCFSGCSYLSTYCYPENNSCMYCNEDGDYVSTAPCLGIVDNVTRQCTMSGYCSSDTYTCTNGVYYQCINNNWRKIEQCSYGCKDGECSSEGAKSYEYIADVGDFLYLWIVSFGLLIAYLSATGLLSSLLNGIAWRIKKWARGKD